MIARLVDRALNRTVGAPLPPPRPDVAAFHTSLPVVDLLAGTALFRTGFLARSRTGHLDLPRARAGGLDLVGLSIATRFPDLDGRLSGPHFRSLGIPTRGRSDLAIATAFVRRVEGWAAASGGSLVLARRSEDLVSVGSDGCLRLFLGVQGGQVIREPGDVERLRRLGVRMVALAHVMDSPLAGSSTGRRAGGLTGLGREVLAEMERLGILVDLAHASSRTIREAVPRLGRPFLVSHTGFTALAGRGSRWRRYAPARRNLSDGDGRLVGEAGGLIGVTLATPLVGGDGLDSVLRAFDHAVGLVGPGQVALGSDFDGALTMPFDASGLVNLTQALLDAGFGRDVVGGIMGGNALRLLQHPT